MAAVDGLSLGAPGAGADWKRWTLAGVAVLALHLGIVALLRQTEPVGGEFAAQTAIEMDLTPPPSGEAQKVEAGANADQVASEETPSAEPEQLEEVQDETPPPDQPEPVTAETAPTEDVQEAQPVETPEVAADDVVTPDDVQAAVSLPPERTVVAQEETPTPRKEPVKAPPKREPVKDVKRDKPVEKPTAKPQTVASQAGGAGGAASSAGASAAAAATYGARVRSAVAAQKRSGTSFTGRASVTFVVNRAGRVSSVSASGPPEAAAEAQAMVRRAALPAMPPEMIGASKTYTLPISFSMR
jgi:protein TonB